MRSEAYMICGEGFFKERNTKLRIYFVFIRNNTKHKVFVGRKCHNVIIYRKITQYFY